MSRRHRRNGTVIVAGVAASVFVALAPLQASAQTAGANRQITYANGDVYVGPLLDNRPHGMGTYRYADGSVYQGELLRGEPSGRGKKVWRSGSVYEGQWLHGQPHGTGKFVFPDGSTYEGEWVAGQQSGRGTAFWKDGSSHEGQWRGGLPNGPGTHRWATGATKSGSWVDGKLVGPGVEVTARGERLEVAYVDDRANGRGTLAWPDGARYEGDFRDGARTGHGVWTNREGDRFEGEWVNGLRQGRGVQTLNGHTTEGTWNQDALVGESISTLAAQRPASAPAVAAALDVSSLGGEHFAFVKASRLVVVKTPEQLLKDCPACARFPAELCFRQSTPVVVHQAQKSGCRPWLSADPDVGQVRSSAARAPQADRDAGKAFFEEGFDLALRGEAAGALVAFEKGIASEPGDMKARYVYANLLLRAGRLLEAVQQYAIVVNLADLRSPEAANSAAQLKTIFP